MKIYAELIGDYKKQKIKNFYDNTLVGKTTLLDQMFVLSPLMSIFNGWNVDVKIDYWSLELPTIIKLMKWVSFFLWVTRHKDIPLEIMDGTKQLSKESFPKLVAHLESKEVKRFVELIEQKVTFFNHLDVDKIDFNRTSKDNVIEEKVIDHIGLVNGKGAIKDKINICSRKLVISRNDTGVTPVVAQQFNRTNNSVERQKFNPTPQRDDFKDSSDTYEACDVAFGIMNPVTFGRTDFRDIDLTKFKETSFRQVQIIKNRYGKAPAGSSIGLYGKLGWLYQLPRNETGVDYNLVNDPVKLIKHYTNI